ncbi:MAG: hypothetical protein AB8E82_00045 [Aureispira sp.]
MSELLLPDVSGLSLSSERLATDAPLQEGEINVFETLKKHKKLPQVIVEEDDFKQELILKWKEIRTPRTLPGYKDLVGKKLAEYKFQYLGQFVLNGNPVNIEQEKFINRFTKEKITKETIESSGWCNCTWLIDFLANAKGIGQDTTRDEQLSWYSNDETWVLELHRKSIGDTSRDQEHFAFDKDLKKLRWKHVTWFAQ